MQFIPVREVCMHVCVNGDVVYCLFCNILVSIRGMLWCVKQSCKITNLLLSACNQDYAFFAQSQLKISDRTTIAKVYLFVVIGDRSQPISTLACENIRDMQLVV